MIWEGQSSLIIMLTTIVERGRIKCHNYWPEVGETVEYGRLAVTCTKEDARENFVFRDFSIRHLDKVHKRRKSGDGAAEAETEVGEEEFDDDDQEVRHVTQMAYLSWPDHGVPENPDEFIQVPMS
jgi:tyrosine-protein phosphatase non-receptor type 4